MPTRKVQNQAVFDQNSDECGPNASNKAKKVRIATGMSTRLGKNMVECAKYDTESPEYVPESSKAAHESSEWSQNRIRVIILPKSFYFWWYMLCSSMHLTHFHCHSEGHFQLVEHLFLRCMPKS